MATNVPIFDKVTRNTKTISVDMRANIIEGDNDGKMDYFIILSTTAKMVNGNAIPVHTINKLTDLVRGSTQQDGITATPYPTMTDAIQDYILHMVEGVVLPGEAMDFN
jgi:hypothetical protein